MHRSSRTKVFALVLLFAAIPCSPDPPPSPIAPAKDAKIRELMLVTGSGQLGIQMVDQLLPALRKAEPEVPEGFWVEFRAEIKAEEVVDLIVPVYAKHFDEADIQGLIDFYSTPLGKKYISELPGVLKESVALGQEWGQQVAARAIKRAKEKGYKLNG